MAFETREGQGALFTNDRKEKADQPDYRGKVRIGGVLYYLSGWERRSNGGTRWLALKAEPHQKAGAEPQHASNNGVTSKKDAQSSASQPAPPAAKRDEFNDDIPF